MYGTEPRILGGRYQLADVIGYGGMAEVYRGHDVRLGREVAVKTLRADLARDPSFHARFRREAQSAAGLNHPSIVSVYDTGEDDDHGQPVPYIVMEFVEGRTLRDVIAQEGRLMPQRALEIVSDVCGALDYSHRMGIVHRDIKPANVMLTTDNQVKVMDFGIARALTGASSTMTATAQVIGTAQYLSPEQARGEQVDARSDVYSTGVLLYELLTGLPPFRGDSPVAVAYQHVREDPQPPSTLDPDIPPEVDAIVLKALAKNPANRYQSAGEMRDDIERALAGQQVYATPLMPMYDDPGATSVVPGGGDTGYGPAAGPPPGGGGDRRWLTWAAIALAVIAVFVLAALLAKNFLGGSSGGGKTAAPKLVNEQLALAEQQLHDAGFPTPRVARKPSAANQNNVVLGQNPTDGQQVAKSTVFVLTVGAGPGTVSVPSVTNILVADAVKQLTTDKLNSTQVSSFAPSNLPAGTVIKQDPVAGTAVAPGSSVTLTVVAAQGTVPDVTAKSSTDAVAELTKDGFNYKLTYRDDTDSDDTVLSQNPAGNSNAGRGATVTLVISRRVTPSPTTPPPTQSPTPSPTQSVSPTDSPTTGAGGFPTFPGQPTRPGRGASD